MERTSSKLLLAGRWAAGREDAVGLIAGAWRGVWVRIIGKKSWGETS